MDALKRWLDHSLARRIAVLVTALLLTVGLAVSLVSYVQVLRVTRQLMSDRLRELGAQLAPLMGRSSNETMSRLGKLATDSAVQRFVVSRGAEARAEATAAIQNRLLGTLTSALVITGADGATLLEVGAPARGPWFGPPPETVAGAAADTGAHLGPFARLNDTTLISDARVPIRGEGRVIGHLVNRGRIALSKTGRSTFAVLLGEGTGIVMGSPSTGLWTDLAEIVPGPPPGALQAAGVNRFIWQGTEYLGTAASIPGTPWVLVVRTPYGVVAAPAGAYLRRVGAITLLVVLLGALAALLLSRQLGRPIREMTEVSEQIASGDEALRADERSPGEVGRLAHSFNAMVDRVAQSTRRLRENEASHRAFVAHASEGIWRVEFVPGLNTRLAPRIQVETWYKTVPLAECNAAMARMHGVEHTGQLASIPLEELFPREDPASQALLSEFIAKGYRCTGAESKGRNGVAPPRIFLNDLIGVVENDTLRRIWGIRRDVTLERRLEERLAQTQRLEAIGRLAGGVAHDFNNLLTAILGYADSLRERFADTDTGWADAGEIERLAVRASELTRHLLAFSRGQVLHPAALNLNEVVRATEVLLRRVIGEDIELKLQLAEPLDSVVADAGQMERVLMNLALNARDAMPEGGVLEIRTAVVELDAEHGGLRPGVPPGAYVMLAVSDSGQGMTEEVRRHVFEPFYTTKSMGRGTGLGLATVYGIVRQSGGDITVYSEAGRGATFKIYLPARRLAAVPVERPPVAAAPSHLSGTETVLVVEDEMPVREVARRALTACGYRVLEAGDGADALRKWERNPSAIDLVLTDMVLPGMTGRDLVNELKRRRQEVRVIIMSGYTGETYPALEALPWGVGYLEKPFSLVELRQRVREALDAPAEGARVG
jgi:signal transduction histidine kinase/ActR/RegA family two-component response regulator